MTLDIPRLRGVSHFYAFWCALVAATLLVVYTSGGVARTAAAIYGAGLCALFGGSALYHRWPWHPRWRPVLRRIDHSTIYVFIAASYTPLALIVLDGVTRWVVLGVVWVGAACGVIFSVAWINAPRALCAATYVALGWVALLCVPQLVEKLPLTPVVLMAAGGVLYTIGAVIFALRRPDPWPRIFGFHEIFHAFTIVAAALHFAVIAGWIVVHQA